MATKFSEFTAGATTANTLIVGFDSNLNTNNKYTLAQLKTGLAITTLYDGNGSLSAARTVTMGTHNLAFASTTAGQEVSFAQNVKISGQAHNNSIPVASGSGTTTITPDWNSGNIQECTLTASTAHTLANATNLKPGATYILIVKQAAGGSGTISSYGTQYEFPDATAPTLTTDGNKADVFTLIAANANTLLCTSVLKFTIN